MAKIDWKAVAASRGYKSLKAVLEKECAQANKWNQKSKRTDHKPDDRYHSLFREIIQCAIQRFEVLGIPVEDSLNEWEDERKYSFLNFYQFNYGRPVNWLGTKRSKPKINYFKKRSGNKKLKKKTFQYPRNNKDRIKQLDSELRLNRKRHKKPRWSMERKCRQAKYRSL